MGTSFERQRLELAVSEIVDRVVRQRLRVEDDLVECKSVWPEPSDGATQLAGLANRAGGADVMWIVGLNENRHEVVPFDDSADFSQWLAQVASWFDGGVFPGAMCTRLVTEWGPVVAMKFRTAERPFVIGKSATDRWVPFRAGTAIRRASRMDLLHILVPRIDQIRYDINAIVVTATPNAEDAATAKYSAAIALYLRHCEERVVYFARQDMAFELRLDEHASPVACEIVHRQLWGVAGDLSGQRTVVGSPAGTEVAVHGPGQVRAELVANGPAPVGTVRTIRLRFTMPTMQNDRALDFDVLLHARERPAATWHWEFRH